MNEQPNFSFIHSSHYYVLTEMCDKYMESLHWRHMHNILNVSEFWLFSLNFRVYGQ